MFYYKDENNNFYCFKNPRDNLIEITEEEFNNRLNNIYKGKNIIYNEEKNRIKIKIEENKKELNATDYKAIKYLEGYLTELEYLPIKNRRENLRREINELEDKLK